MLSGLKFIPRDQIDSARDEKLNNSGRGGEKSGKKKKKSRHSSSSDDVDGNVGFSHSLNERNIIRKEMGLEWMLRPKDDMERKSATSCELPDEEEVKKGNPRELNPYLKDNGTGGSGNHLLSVGDIHGGASWRLKALKRAQEQTGEQRTILDVQNNIGKESLDLKGGRGSVQHPKMRVPKLHDSLSWGKRKSSRNMFADQDAGLISSAVSTLNKFANDGSFMRGFKGHQNDDSGPSFGSSNKLQERKVDSDVLESERPDKGSAVVSWPALGANQSAAKVMELRMKGKHDEAEKLLKEAEENKKRNNSGGESSRPQGRGDTSRYTIQSTIVRQKRKEEDSDMHLAQTIVQNKQYRMSGQADDFDEEGPRRKTRKKGGNDPQKIHAGTRILTQQERCNFCFENPNRPRHLVVAIANFTYLMLPQWQPVAPGHCCILPILHESSTWTVDNNVWDEIRNFKKRLIMMFAKQDKELVFIETVMGLAQQQRHCLVEFIPLPHEIASQAPLYFKKAIDEAESEWSQHNAKKLIDTSEKGFRASIPKDFPYFHVEFGLKKGFVHVIDEESQFRSNFGLNVIRGML